MLPAFMLLAGCCSPEWSAPVLLRPSTIYPGDERGEAAREGLVIVQSPSPITAEWRGKLEKAGAKERE